MAPSYPFCGRLPSRLNVRNRQQRGVEPGRANPGRTARATTGVNWDVTSGKEKASLAGHSDSVLSVSWSPDGQNPGQRLV